MVWGFEATSDIGVSAGHRIQDSSVYVNVCFVSAPDINCAEHVVGFWNSHARLVGFS